MNKTIPSYHSLKAAVEDLFGSARYVSDRRYVSGGDINEAAVLRLDDGTRLFMKTNSPQAYDNFLSEAEGLAAMRETGAVRTPEVFGIGTDSGGTAFLLMEYIDGGRPSGGYWEELGSSLARMHKAPCSEGLYYGWKKDNYIGARKQINNRCESWIAFFRDCRLEPQIQAAGRYLDENDRKKVRYLLSHLDRYLCEPEKPSLVHGDLWSGNVMPGEGGSAWLIDPAVYYGHPEADLAMSELFGGFSGVFYKAYRETNPMEPGYEDRRDLYNLYQLLNHLNMFGSGWLPSVRQILKRYAG